MTMYQFSDNISESSSVSPPFKIESKFFVIDYKIYFPLICDPPTSTPTSLLLFYCQLPIRTFLLFIGCTISILVGKLCMPSPPSAANENKSTKTWSAWGRKVTNLSKEKDQEPFPQWAFIGFILHRNTDKAHQSLSGSKDQTIDNIQRTLESLFWVRVS